MICALKLPEDRACLADIPKAVFSYWPSLGKSGEATTIANVCLTFRTHELSPAPLNGAILLFRPNHIRNGSLRRITRTLLDAANPLSTSYTGQYQKAAGSVALLDKYDGVDTVFVDCWAQLQHGMAPEQFDIVAVNFSRPVRQDSCAAVRFLYESPGLFVADRDETYHLSYSFLSLAAIAKHFGERHLRAREIPILTTYDQDHNGGFDIFFYMPSEFKGDEFSVDPTASLLPHYDYLGRATCDPFKKFCWQGRVVAGVRDESPHALHVGSDITISGVFYRRIQMSTIDNKGIMIIGSPQAHVSGVSISQSDSDKRFIAERMGPLMVELENSLADPKTLSNEQKQLVKPYVDQLKAPITSGNRNLLRLTLDGLKETIKTAGAVAPGIAKCIEAFKDL